MKMKIVFLLLIPLLVNASDSKRLQEKVELAQNEKSIPIFFIKLIDPSKSETEEYQAQVVCTLDPEENHIQSLLTNSDYSNKGYGARLFKKAIVTFYELRPNMPITFEAFSLKSGTMEDLEKLVKYYEQLGATKDANQKSQKNVAMHYPLNKAAIMASLLPILEPEPLVEKPKYDPLLLVFDYMYAKPSGPSVKHERTLKERAKK